MGNLNKEIKHIDFYLDEQLNSEINDLSEDRIVRGYASTWDVDTVNDRITRNAFDDTIEKHFNAEIRRKGSPDIRFCREHKDIHIIGRLDVLRADEKGLYFEAYISKTVMGEETYILLKDRAIDKVSIGFVIEDEGREGKTRLIKKLRLYEISIVCFPANEKAEVISVKSLETDMEKNKVEKFLAELSSESQEKFIDLLHGMLTPKQLEAVVEEPVIEEEKAVEKITVPCTTCNGTGQIELAEILPQSNKTAIEEKAVEKEMEDELKNLKDKIEQQSILMEVNEVIKSALKLLEEK